MDLYQLIAGYIEDTRQKIAAARSDGKITASEAFQLFADCIERLVNAAASLKLSGADKKAAVLAAIDKLYDSVIAPIDIPYIPEMVERTIVDPALKKITLAASDGLVEFFVARLSPQESANGPA